MSETSAARHLLSPFCKGLGIDLGFGGDPITHTAITFDQPQPYTNVGDSKQILRGDCRNLSMICDNSLDFVYSSHLIEDFLWKDIPAIVREWRRVLKPGGTWITLCPDEPIYSAHCRDTGQPYNLAHKNADFTLATFKRNVVEATGPWEIVEECPLVNTYSWYLVCKKN